MPGIPVGCDVYGRDEARAKVGSHSSGESADHSRIAIGLATGFIHEVSYQCCSRSTASAATDSLSSANFSMQIA